MSFLKELKNQLLVQIMMTGNMKKLLLILLLPLFVCCSKDDGDYSNNDTNDLTDDTSNNDNNNSNNLYTIELKKLFKNKDNLINGSSVNRWGYVEQYGTGNKQHRSVDTLIIDFSVDNGGNSNYYVANTDPFDHPYEYIRYIKVINYSSSKKLIFGDAFKFDEEKNNCTSGMIFSAWLNGNGATTDHDAMGYFNSNLSEDEIKSLTDLSSTNGNQPFIKVNPSYENEFLKLQMYQQPFGVNFPNGLEVGDNITYNTKIENCNGDNSSTIHKSNYKVVSINVE